MIKILGMTRRFQMASVEKEFCFHNEGKISIAE